MCASVCVLPPFSRAPRGGLGASWWLIQVHAAFFGSCWGPLETLLGHVGGFGLPPLPWKPRKALVSAKGGVWAAHGASGRWGWRCTQLD
eukprot:5198258-Pyramimonas_sp.AAC.1